MQQRPNIVGTLDESIVFLGSENISAQSILKAYAYNRLCCFAVIFMDIFYRLSTKFTTLQLQ